MAALAFESSVSDNFGLSRSRQSSPTLSIWLDVNLGVFLDLESSYEETCHVLRIA
jgi:hypothetical protein